MKPKDASLGRHTVASRVLPYLHRFYLGSCHVVDGAVDPTCAVDIRLSERPCTVRHEAQLHQVLADARHYSNCDVIPPMPIFVTATALAMASLPSTAL